MAQWRARALNSRPPASTTRGAWIHLVSMPRDAPARDWCFTLNNPEAKHFQRLLELEYHYIVFQVEIGEEGTPHYQGFVQLQEKQNLTALKKLISNKVHWEKRRGTPYEASHYCMKPVENCKCKHCDGLERFDQFFEDGAIRAENQYKTHEVARTIKEQGLTRAIERFPEAYLTMNRGMQALEAFYSPKRDYPTEVTVLYGLSRTGKTRYAMEAWPSPYKLAVRGGSGSDFFGEYQPREHETVVLDDFYGGWKYTTFLQVADRYPTEVHTKGGFLQFLARHLVITSNCPPDEWYPKVLLNPDRRDSFFNRINNIVHFTGVGVYAVSKGHLPFPPRPWMSRLTVNEVLMNPQNNPVPPIVIPAHSSFLPRSAYETRNEWLRAHRQ